MAGRKYSFSVIIPVYNEETLIKRKTLELIGYIKSHMPGEKYQILFSENGSSDNTLGEIKSLARKFSFISYTSSPVPDPGVALKSGFRMAGSEKIVWLPIDFNDNLLDFTKRSIKRLDEYDMVLASKRAGQDTRGWKRVLLNRGFNLMLRFLFRIRVKDIEGYKAYRKSRIADILGKVRSRSHMFDVELFLLAYRKGLSFCEEPVKIVEIRRKGYISSTGKFIRIVMETLMSLIKFKLYGY